MRFFEAAPGRAHAIKKNFFAGFAFFTSKWNYCRVTGPQNKIFIKNQLTLIYSTVSIYIYDLYDTITSNIFFLFFVLKRLTGFTETNWDNTIQNLITCFWNCLHFLFNFA
jgi:hypothetical protein